MKMNEFNRVKVKTKLGNELVIFVEEGSLFLTNEKDAKTFKIERLVKDRKAVGFVVDGKAVCAEIDDSKHGFTTVEALFNTVQKTGRKLMILGKSLDKWDQKYWENKKAMNLGEYFVTILNGEHLYVCYQYDQAKN